MVDRGYFITFEGPEGSGKSTVSESLYNYFNQRSIPVLRTREPGGTATGEAVRNILQHDSAGETIFAETETLLFEASRAQLVRSIIQPALTQGTTVLCDRFYDSTTAYQGYGRGFNLDNLAKLHEFAVGDCHPDLTILLDIDVKKGFARQQKEKDYAPDRMEREEISFHQKVRKGYLDIASRYSKRFYIADANKSSEEVFQEVLWAIGSRTDLLI